MSNLKDILFMKRRNAWFKTDRENIFKFAQGYKDFLKKCKTERETVKFVNEYFLNNRRDREFIIVNRNKSVALIRLSEDFGMKMIASHIDAPRIDLKQNPLFEDSGLGLFHTHYYGGIKKYQWLNIPISLHIFMVKSNKETLEINIGEELDDPIFVIPDLLPHLSKKVIDEKVTKEAFDANKLNIICGSIPFSEEEKDQIKLNILNYLYERYKIVEEDFVSAEIQAVPAFEPRDLGFDRSLVGAYGQDDRICAYASLMAFFDVEISDKTQVLLMVDKEEIGSEGNTSAQSSFVYDIVIEILKRKGIEPTFANILNFFKSSQCLSADVSAAVNPMYKEVHETDNAAYINNGVVITKFTGHGGKYYSNDANTEFVAKVKEAFNRDNVIWQIAELGKVDEGGGGTIAKYISKHNIETLDCGPALISMHSPFEIASKADLYETYKAYKSFLMMK
ncbi:Aspartyl aminopeptidase [Thermodesulfobium acidiphilum]|uniref:M18 family aminopeptidase n=2 Tax=Thermodesulfobium acidiphilum TaxID=1794699 RepID=A0A2R4W107_THEAF|nr:aminopeptidase [Thermodesulfobium acidiphilum]AWB10497.1 Aspartyl aminopeptidase [Thermodesulfobium acidiphilum]PMP85157.1 MAG: aminopeptidase [Thermodesulfobium narugense]